MENIFYEGQIIWAMIDFNGHLRHSAYADCATQARSCTMEQYNIPQTLIPQKIGPILLREETKYFRELKLNEKIKISVEIIKARSGYSRFTMQSIVYRAGDNKK